MSKKTARKYAELQKTSEVEKPLLDQFQTGEWNFFSSHLCPADEAAVLRAVVKLELKYLQTHFDILGGHH